jgi:hypothetical protein
MRFRELGEDRRGVRRHLDLEALGQLRDPGELVRRGRDGGASEALEAPLEVDVGAVPLEVARARRTRSAQPTASPWNIEVTITRSARSASARTFGSAAASSPETNSSPISFGASVSSSQQAAQASATPRPFGVAGRWKAPQPGLSANRASGERREMRAAAPSSADQIRIARSLSRQPLAERRGLPASRGSSRPRRLTCTTSAPRGARP